MITNNSILSILYILIIGFHLTVSWNQSSAHVIPDEVSYLTQARYFSGKDAFPDTKAFLARESSFAGSDTLPSTENWPYYHFGYSLLVSPIYWLADTPSAAYKGIMIFNSFMLSTLFLIIFFWIRMISKVKFPTAIAISFIVSLYPPYVFQAQIGWAENAFIPGFALCCLLYTQHLRTNSITTVILFSLMAGFQFTIHPRGLAVVIAATICLICLSLVDKDKWHLSLIGVSIISVIFIITKLISGELAIMMDTVSHGDTIIQNLSSIFELELLTAVIGNLLYLALATLGFFLFGVTEGVKQIINTYNKNPKSLVSDIYTGPLIFLFTASSLMFCVSIAFLGRSEEWHNISRTLDFFLYGRYNEAFLSIYIALGLLWICHTHGKNLKNLSKPLNISFWILAAVSIAFFLLLSDFRYLRSIHSFGLFPWYIVSTVTVEWLGNAPIYIAPLLWTWLVLQLFLQSNVKGLVTIGIYFFLLNISLLVYHTPSLQIFG